MPDRASRWENGNRVAHAQPFWDDSRKRALGIPAQSGLNNTSRGRGRRRARVRGGLPRQVRLIQNRKTSASKDRSCALGIVQMQSKCRTTMGTEQERVANLNVD